jgi:hypothetical protein
MTNKGVCLATVRKRAPGGGRKPKGPMKGKQAAFSTRITLETRQAMEAEADRTRQSVSQVAEHLLILGVKAKRDRERDDPMRALCFLIDQLAISVSNSTQGAWRENPFLFEALRLAIPALMARLAPPGDMQSPEPVLSGFKTPEERAAFAVEFCWENLQRQPGPRQNEDLFAELPPQYRAALESLIYAYSHARKDLEIKGSAK